MKDPLAPDTRARACHAAVNQEPKACNMQRTDSAA